MKKSFIDRYLSVLIFLYDVEPGFLAFSFPEILFNIDVLPIDLGKQEMKIIIYKQKNEKNEKKFSNYGYSFLSG